MVDHTSRLPDEVASYILSFLTVRDSVRARLSSSRWLQLPDSRSVLRLNCRNVLGDQNIWKGGPSLESVFVRIVNHYMELPMGNRISKLILYFDLGNEHASHIDRWIATSVAMEVEEIQLDFTGIRGEQYVFPSHLLCFGKAPQLKRLSLRLCKMSLSSRCTSWLSNLTTLHLTYVPLDQSGLQHILCAGSNLISLVLTVCSLRGTLFINGQLPHLKKFITHGNDFNTIKLNCPNLEVFEYDGLHCIMYFAHVPILREVSVWYGCDPVGYCSRLFNHVTNNAPQLEALSLKITHSEVQIFRLSLARCSLKRLNLYARIPIGFDLLTITDMLNASPFLETLEIELDGRDYVKHSQRREYPDHPHFHLKEVKIEGFSEQWNEVELAMYILRNAVALERVVIDTQGLTENQKATTLLLQKKMNPTAEVIIL